MQSIIICSTWTIPPLKSLTFTSKIISGKHPPFLGRRKLCFDVVSRLPVPPPPPRGDDGNHLDIVERGFPPEHIPLTTRRTLFTRLLMCCSNGYLLSSRYSPAYALGDPSVTLEQVTPAVFPAGKLFPSEERIANLFEKNTYSVVNIFDVSLRPQLNISGAVEIPEGNGSGVVWDDQGHIVTNYHVIGSSHNRGCEPQTYKE